MSEIKLKYDTKPIEELNDKITKATEAVASTESSIEEKQNEIDATFAEIANGSATVEQAKKLQSELDELKQEYIANERIVQALKQAKEEKAPAIGDEIEQARKEAFEKLQKKYDEAYKNEVIPARKAFIEALAKLGGIQKNGKRVNGQANGIRSNANVPGDSYYKQKSIRTLELGKNEWRKGSEDYTGYGVDNHLQRSAHDSGTIPFGF